MSTNTSHILEQYIEGKDSDNHTILENIYSENGVVEFEIASKSISFPERIRGNMDIAVVLSKDFNQKYQHVKTYYLSKPTDNNGNIYMQQWLVVMKELATAKTRIGAGYYDWEFSIVDSVMKIQRHKIHIHEMLSLEDPNMSELLRIQTSLSYPWAERAKVRNVLEINSNLDVITRYLG